MDGHISNSNSLYQVHQPGTRTNFTQCHTYYSGLSREIKFDLNFAWTGSVRGIEPNNETQIQTWACRELCGRGNDWYPWTQQASTITTWVLPVVGVLLQAPFVSNAFWETVFSIGRWIGSPICTLSYIFWNISVTAKGALLLDMAVPYESIKRTAGWQADFVKMRDSFYLLTTMNQFTMRTHVRQKKEAEGLLRIALFSKDLRLLKHAVLPKGMFARAFSEGPVLYGEGWRLDAGATDHVSPPPLTPEGDLELRGYLGELRERIALEMRASRKRGVVPVFVSTAWFLFSLGLSIQAAFGFLGENAQAHDLALGLLLAWLPVLILSSIVDRNPIAADEIKDKVNSLVDRVRLSLMDDMVRKKFLETINPNQCDQMRQWLNGISAACPSLEVFFVHFAGQGRKRYHYGVAHPILTDIESAYIAGEGRDWLCNEEEARNKLVLGDSNGGLDWLDPRELWQVLSAVTIVGGAVVGAFILSFFTPTVGLGCRSGGYTVFGTIAFGLLLVEMVSWWMFDASKTSLDGLNDRIRRLAEPYVTSRWARLWLRSKAYVGTSKVVSLSRKLVSFSVHSVQRLLPEAAADAVESGLRTWQGLSTQKRLDYCFFKPVECANTIWLFYIVLAQTVGSYRNCKCMSSTWGGGGGYIDWNNYSTATNIKGFWITGTVLSVTTMSMAMLYIVLEWCLQSHLSTLNVENAARGLHRTRRFRLLTNPYRRLIHNLIEGAYKGRLILFRICFRRGKDAASGVEPRSSRRSVRWTKEITCTKAGHDHVGSGRQMLAVPVGRPRGGSDSDVPLVTGSDFNGLSLSIDTTPAFAYRYPDAPSSHSSYDTSPSSPSGPA